VLLPRARTSLEVLGPGQEAGLRLTAVPIFPRARQSSACWGGGKQVRGPLLPS
jgi:hypothetical protein